MLSMSKDVIHPFGITLRNKQMRVRAMAINQLRPWLFYNNGSRRLIIPQRIYAFQKVY